MRKARTHTTDDMTLAALQTKKVRLFDAIAQPGLTDAERDVLRAQFREVVVVLAQLPSPRRGA